MDEFITSRRSVLAGTLAGSACMLAGRAMADDAGAPTAAVETTSGKVRGLRAGGLSRFFGIPYGADTGQHRFQPARRVAAWTGVRDCNALGPKTPQGPITLPGIMGKVDPSARAIPVMMAVAGITNAKIPESEDCLVLNVITPDASRVRKRPVMVWLHGGAFAMGSGFDSMTDGSLLAGQGDVVYVSLNHRLNAMGFLYLGALHDDFADSGNAGMLDIVLALEWVRDNIEAFGGDPGNVTIFGQSGGGAKVSTLLGMLPAKGLFHKAIAMSGPIVTLVEKQDAAAIAEQTLASLGVAKADVHRLQTLPYGQVIQAASAVRLPPALDGGLASRTLAPMVDGRSIPAHPFDPGATEISRDVPLMIGTAKDEATLFMAGDPELGHMSEDHARERFRTALGDKGDAAFERYRSGYPKDDPSYWVSTMMTDRLFRSQSIVQADRKSAQKAAAVYMYRVDYEPRVVDRILRSPHGTEVPLVFGTKVPVQFVSSGPEVDALSARLMRAWLNFVRTGNPSQEGLEWPRYDTRRRLNMIFDAPCHVVADPDPVARDPVARGIA
ncbi:carboxylesterase/lipase family protein [Novosphingobium sp. G106]|uniref:carboxylesterase/lipase family protein n=1 Tax=Novosphingobium sp. G106 TaxID=2849500 RepID=UPI001C2DE4BE|nr:carboxylesterase/lipase family protein [Novosphingobium sp. G106]MBV1686741.1 carboxylesterase/lipase family protein [Novosphingobium sp. G106]